MSTHSCFPMTVCANHNAHTYSVYTFTDDNSDTAFTDAMDNGEIVTVTVGSEYNPGNCCEWFNTCILTFVSRINSTTISVKDMLGTVHFVPVSSILSFDDVPGKIPVDTDNVE